MVRLLSFILTLFLFVGCQTTGVVLRETPLGASETRKAIVAVIGEPRSMSEQGRELVSHYYDRKGGRIEKMDIARERYFSIVTILNDRRPYDLRVEVFHELRNSEGAFEEQGHDDDRADVLAEKIKQSLNQSRDKRNVIDDFRSF